MGGIIEMLLIGFFVLLLGCWGATVLTAFCPLRAYRNRKNNEDFEV